MKIPYVVQLYFSRCSNISRDWLSDNLSEFFNAVLLEPPFGGDKSMVKICPIIPTTRAKNNIFCEFCEVLKWFYPLLNLVPHTTENKFSKMLLSVSFLNLLLKPLGSHVCIAHNLTFSLVFSNFANSKLAVLLNDFWTVRTPVDGILCNYPLFRSIWFFLRNNPEMHRKPPTIVIYIRIRLDLVSLLVITTNLHRYCLCDVMEFT